MSIFSMYKKMKQTIKAPSYFKQINKDINEIDKMISNSLGVSIHWYREQEKKDTETFNEVVAEYAKKRKWTDKDKEKMRFLISAKDIFIGYSWHKFRFQHLLDAWGTAESLVYNEDKDEIQMKWFFPKVRNIVKRVKKKLKR